MAGTLRLFEPTGTLALLVFAGVLLTHDSCLTASTDLSVVTLFDAERSEPLNTWGGAWSVGNARHVRLASGQVHSGRRALGIAMGELKAGERTFVQSLACGFGPGDHYKQTRDLASYQRLDVSLENATAATLRGFLTIKDYRDSAEQQAVFGFDLPVGGKWTHLRIPLDLASAGWSVTGTPDLTRVLAIDFVFEPQSPLAGGDVWLDDLMLVERGGPMEIAATPLPQLVERLAHRQFNALWAARSRAHGMIPNNSYQTTDAGLNTTAAVLWMLPSAVRHRWVEPEEADRYVAELLNTVGHLLDRAKYLPPRNIDWVTLEPSLLPEESSVDAAFLALALHQYWSLGTTPPKLRRAITETQERFDFVAFATPAGWCMAHRYASATNSREGLIPWTYDGYTNEGRVVSLAAHLAQRRHVPIEKLWNSDVQRVRAPLVADDEAPVVHAWPEYRAPFAQALLNLFVDVRQRGTDGYPDARLATNPWHNFVCYERCVMKRLAELGRPLLVQPDAGDDGTLSNYRPFSLYQDYGQSDLFMPWSVSFALLANADGSEEALRYLLDHGLHDATGLADSARWTTGAAEPHSVSARHDFWNTALATMALLEWLDGDSRLSTSFAALPEVRAALDHVLPAPRGDASRTPWGRVGALPVADATARRLPALRADGSPR